MRKQLQKSLSLFLLAVVLATQVGLHLLHHHSSSHHSSDTVTLQEAAHQHCAICGLDLFVAQDLPSTFSFAIFLIHEGEQQVVITSATSFSIIFNPGRAPPVS